MVKKKTRNTNKSKLKGAMTYIISKEEEICLKHVVLNCSGIFWCKAKSMIVREFD